MNGYLQEATEMRADCAVCMDATALILVHRQFVEVFLDNCSTVCRQICKVWIFELWNGLSNNSLHRIIQI